MRDENWTDAATLQATLGVSRATFYRRTNTGEIECAEIGGVKLYRAAVRLTDQSHTVSPSRNNQRQPETDSRQGETRDETRDAAVLALVTRYETRIDALLVDHQAATQRAAALAVELEAERGRSAAALEAERGRVALAKLEAEHARQLAERDRAREAAAVEAAKLEAERIREAAATAVEAARLEAERQRAAVEAAHAVEVDRLRAAATADLEIATRAREEAAAATQEERQRREAAEARAAAVEALAALAWWRFGARRRARAAVEGRRLLDA